MKNLVSNSVKLLTLVGCVFVMFSCGGDNECQTCVLEGVADTVICEDDFTGDITGLAYDAAILAQTTAGATCTKN